jgi:starch phosphorylase
MTKEKFKKEFKKKVEELSSEKLENSTTKIQYEALAQMVMEDITPVWAENRRLNRINSEKQIYFFSIEFLIGRLLRLYINNLGLENVIPEALKNWVWIMTKSWPANTILPWATAVWAV